MKKIEEYVDKLYLNAKGNAKEIRDLKMEMKSHLIETVEELKSEGHSEDEAIQIAKERFGEVHELRALVGEMVQTQKSFGRRILYFALSVLAISTALFVLILTFSSDQESEQAIIAYEIAELVSGKESLSNSEKNDIELLIRDATYITQVKTYNTNGLNGNHNSIASEPIHVIEKDGWALPFLLNTYSYGNENSFVVLEVRDYRIIAFLTLFTGLASALTLLIIQGIIRIYSKRKMNMK